MPQYPFERPWGTLQVSTAPSVWLCQRHCSIFRIWFPLLVLPLKHDHLCTFLCSVSAMLKLCTINTFSREYKPNNTLTHRYRTWIFQEKKVITSRKVLSYLFTICKDINLRMKHKSSRISIPMKSLFRNSFTRSNSKLQFVPSFKFAVRFNTRFFCIHSGTHPLTSTELIIVCHIS